MRRNVTGLERLRYVMTKEIPQRARKAARAALEQSANEIVAQMKAIVQYDSGDLHDSIGWTWGEPPKGAIAIATSAVMDDALRITIYAGNDKAYYARFVEFGTIKNSAKPFFFPVWRANRSRARSRVSRAIKKSLTEAKKR